MINWWRNRGLLLVALMAAVGVVRGQEPVRLTDARFEPQEVVLGDHFDLVMEVEAAEGCAVAFPDLSAGFAEGEIELIKDGEVDTISRGEGLLGLRKRYTLIGFEANRYAIDSLGVLYATSPERIDTLLSRVALEVNIAMIPTDSTQTTIYPIKPPMKVSLRVGEVAGYVGAILLGVVLLFLLIRYIAALVGRRSKRVVVTPAEPPHVVAIRRLEQLHNQKLWQNGRLKEYYTALTDILREYLDGRYGVDAPEMTSEEILSALKRVGVSAKHYADLQRLLGESDLVKFAKYLPEQEYHEEAYYKVYYFVEESKVVPTEEESVTYCEQKDENQ